MNDDDNGGDNDCSDLLFCVLSPPFVLHLSVVAAKIEIYHKLGKKIHRSPLFRSCQNVGYVEIYNYLTHVTLSNNFLNDVI